jgi:hypothetical protein
MALGNAYLWAEFGNNSLGVVDLKDQKIFHRVAGLNEPQGVAYVSAVDCIFVSNGGDGSLRVFSGSDFSPVARVELKADADNLRVDAIKNLVFAGFGSGGLAVIDARSRKKVGEIDLKGHPEGFELEPSGERAFVNVPDARVSFVAMSPTKAAPNQIMRNTFSEVVEESGINHLRNGSADAVRLNVRARVRSHLAVLDHPYVRRRKMPTPSPNITRTVTMRVALARRQRRSSLSSSRLLVIGLARCRGHTRLTELVDKLLPKTNQVPPETRQPL